MESCLAESPLAQLLYAHMTPGVFQKEAIGKISFLNLSFIKTVVQKDT